MKDNEYSSSTLSISWSAIQHNISYFRSKLNTETNLMIMVKAAAYGNGAVEISKRIEEHNLAEYLAVAYLEEGIELRKAGVQLPIMILNPNPNYWRIMVENCLEPEIHNLFLFTSFCSFLAENDSISANYPIHLKFNTGMNRLGIDENELDELGELLNKNGDSLKVKSMMTHLSSSDLDSENEFTTNQLQQFDKVATKVENHLGYSPHRHTLNSNGINQFPKHQYQMVRLGIGMYGTSTIDELEVKLKPVCKLTSVVCSVRRVDQNASISYSRSGRVDEECNIATLSIGYADGVSKRLGNGNWEVEINGKLYPTIGTICMDLLMVNLGQEIVDVGSKVIIFGGKKSIYDYAKAMNTITYEAMTSIGKRVKRKIID